MPSPTVSSYPLALAAPAWTLCIPSDVPFPPKLLGMLQFAEQMNFTDIVSWLPHGRAFKIHDAEKFMSQVASKFLLAKKLRSFHRQLLVWGFQRNCKGEDKGAWFHKSFLRDHPKLMKNMLRVKYGFLRDQPKSMKNKLRRKERGERFIKTTPITQNHMSLLQGQFEYQQKTPAQLGRVTPSLEVSGDDGSDLNGASQRASGKVADQSQSGMEGDKSLHQIFGSDFKDSLMQVPDQDFDQVLLEIIDDGTEAPVETALIS